MLLNINSSISAKDEEKLCDRFAGAILLPKNILIKEIGTKRSKISLTELINFQKQYGISIAAIMYRLVSSEIILQNKIKKFYILQNKNDDFKNTANKVRFQGIEKSERYNRLVFKALSQEIISISKASALLNKDIDSLQQELSLI